MKSVQDYTSSFCKSLSLALLGFYQAHISCHLMTACRFHPTCSQYAVTVMKEESFLKALKLILKRLSKCHPFYKFPKVRA